MRRSLLLAVAVLALAFALQPAFGGEVKPADPIPTSAPGCICPHAGSGWAYTGDDCKLQLPDARICTGTCKWKNAEGRTTTTECGTP